MTWRGWMIFVAVGVVAFMLLLTVSIWGGNKVDRFNAENSGIFVMGWLMPELMPEQIRDRNRRNR